MVKYEVNHEKFTQEEIEYQECVEASRPTPEQVAEFIKQKGWLTFADLKESHLNEQELQTFRTAVASCKDYVAKVNEWKSVGYELKQVKKYSEYEERQKELETKLANMRPPSMILVASSVDGDLDRTGYGCGKTTLANIIRTECHDVRFVVNDYGYSDMASTFWVESIGKIYTSKDLMALFDESADAVDHAILGIKGMLIIDDLGREGSLRWEKRDPALQLEEKQNRYYTVINHCYERKIPIVITSNLTSREMASFLGGASWSRLLQMTPKQYRINMTGIRDMRPILSDDEFF